MHIRAPPRPFSLCSRNDFRTHFAFFLKSSNFAYNNIMSFLDEHKRESGFFGQALISENAKFGLYAVLRIFGNVTNVTWSFLAYLADHDKKCPNFGLYAILRFFECAQK